VEALNRKRVFHPESENGAHNVYYPFGPNYHMHFAECATLQSPTSPDPTSLSPLPLLAFNRISYFLIYWYLACSLRKLRARCADRNSLRNECMMISPSRLMIRLGGACSVNNVVRAYFRSKPTVQSTVASPPLLANENRYSNSSFWESRTRSSNCWPKSADTLCNSKALSPFRS